MSALPKLPHAAPANDPPQLRTMESIASEFGFKTARAVRDWCKRRGVPYRRDGKINWVDRNAVLGAIHGRPVVVAAAAPASASVGDWFDNTLGGSGGSGGS